MYPILTYIRHKGIAAVLSLSRTLYKASGARRPKMLFSESALKNRVGSNVRILSEDKTSVTIAKMNRDGSFDPSPFKILTATDFHMDPGSEELNNKTVRFFTRWIAEEKPDLVIVTGDVILSDCQQIDAVQFSQMMEKLGVYWCYVFGNHEAREEKEYFKYLLYKGLMYCPHCLNRFGDKNLYGYGNFAVHIKNGEHSLLKSLFLFDSGRNVTEKYLKQYGLPGDFHSYDFLKREQIDWYKNEVRLLEYRYPEVKTLAYMHIPLPEFAEVFSGSEKEGFTPSGKAQLVYGEQYESVGAARYNSHFFDEAVDTGTLQGVFAGHDHINDFAAVYRGVYLVYTQATGYNTYSMADKAGWKEADCQHGVTLTTLFPDGSILPEQRKNSRFVSRHGL